MRPDSWKLFAPRLVPSAIRIYSPALFVILKELKMVEILSDFPPHVAAYRAWGAISKEEYEQVVMARVDEVAAEYGRINFLVLLETDIENYSVGAFIDYLRISFRHFNKWNHMAIVSDQQWVRKGYDILSPLVHGEVRGYKLSEYYAARQWVSEPFR